VRVKIECPYNLDLSDDEEKALDWLHNTLCAITSKPKHKNKKNARLIIRVIGKMLQHTSDLHARLHEVEVFSEVRKENDERVLN
jgi:ribosomal protein L13